MKRRLLVVAILTLAPIAMAFFWPAQSVDSIDAANFNRIEIGMTQQEVENILGGPGGEIQEEVQGRFIPGQSIGSPKVWNGCQSAIIIRFKLRGNKYVVASKEFFNPGLWEQFKAWWGGYELNPFPVGGRSKRLEPAA